MVCNDANEITDINETAANPWADTDHDAAGNMIEMPKVHQPEDGMEAVYDAWNRMVELIDEDTSQTIARYEWDGMNRRIVKETFSAGIVDETRHFYYSQQHQILEERVDGNSSSDLDVQYVWGIRYVDELILRDRDTTGNGNTDERRYALQDANFNVVALADTSGGIVERYSYTPYGQHRAQRHLQRTSHRQPRRLPHRPSGPDA